jgi:hypothetical protein
MGPDAGLVKFTILGGGSTAETDRPGRTRIGSMTNTAEKDRIIFMAVLSRCSTGGAAAEAGLGTHTNSSPKPALLPIGRKPERHTGGRTISLVNNYVPSHYISKYAWTTRLLAFFLLLLARANAQMFCSLRTMARIGIPAGPLPGESSDSLYLVNKKKYTHNMTK